MDVVDDRHKSINGDSMCMFESQQTDVASLSASSSVSSIPSPNNNDDSLNQDSKIRCLFLNFCSYFFFACLLIK